MRAYKKDFFRKTNKRTCTIIRDLFRVESAKKRRKASCLMFTIYGSFVEILLTFNFHSVEMQNLLFSTKQAKTI